MRDFVLPRKELSDDNLFLLLPVVASVAVALVAVIYMSAFMRGEKRVPNAPIVDREFAIFCDKMLPVGERIAASDSLVGRPGREAHLTDEERSFYNFWLNWIIYDDSEPPEIKKASAAYLGRIGASEGQ
ncbi:MAG: hypothetical protein WC712_00700 [Candidatus Brocadiia bacterium]